MNRWTTEQTKILRGQLAEGRNPSEIAIAMKQSLNFVLRKIDRLGAENWWTGEREEILRRGWQQGLSARQISRQFNEEISRCAVIGKARRLHLGSRKKGTKKGDKKSRKRHVRNNYDFRAVHLELEDENIPFSPVSIEINCQPCSLFELTNETCRFPCGDPCTPDFYFCGIPEADNSGGWPYCPAHSRIVYRISTISRQRGIERLAVAV